MRDDAGFSFPELLVVMLIVGILAAIALPLLLPKQNRASDVAAKANAGSVVTHVEACFTETDDYRRCEPGADPGLGDIGLPIGTVEGGVRVRASGPDAYRIDAYSTSGNVFSLRRRLGGPTDRFCSVPPGAPDQGGCSGRPNGTW